MVKVKIRVHIRIRGQGPTEANNEGQGRRQHRSLDSNAQRFFALAERLFGTEHFLKTTKKSGVDNTELVTHSLTSLRLRF